MNLRHRFFISSQVYRRIVLFQQSSTNRRRSTVWTISDLQEVVRIYAHNLAAGFPATPRWCEDQQPGSSVGMSIDSKSSFAAGFPATSEAVG